MFYVGFFCLFFIFKIVSCRLETIVDCNDSSLDTQGCVCALSGPKPRPSESMTCNVGYITNSSLNKLPGLSTSVPFSVEISYTYTVFPIVPVSYLSLTNLNLQENLIPNLGDLTNLANLTKFSLRHNLITELTPQLGCILTKCQQMDFSYNRIETISFENFVCFSNTSSLNSNNLYVFSSLQALMLTGNLIKVKNIFYKIFKASTKTKA